MINRWSVSVSLLNLTTHWMTGNHRSALDGLFLLAFFRVTRVIYSRLNRHLLGAFRFSREIVFKKTTTKITVLFAFWLVSLEKRLVIICRFIDLFVHLELAAVTIKRISAVRVFHWILRLQFFIEMRRGNNNSAPLQQQPVGVLVINDSQHTRRIQEQTPTGVVLWSHLSLGWRMPAQLYNDEERNSSRRKKL